MVTLNRILIYHGLIYNFDEWGGSNPDAIELLNRADAINCWGPSLNRFPNFLSIFPLLFLLTLTSHSKTRHIFRRWKQNLQHMDAYIIAAWMPHRKNLKLILFGYDQFNTVVRVFFVSTNINSWTEAQNLNLLTLHNICTERHIRS